MPTEVPFIPSTPFYRVQVTLDGSDFIFDVSWNDRDAAWYLDVYTVEEDPVYMGIKIVLGTFLGARCADSRFPNGLMAAKDVSGQQIDPGIDDLGKRVVVWYYTPAEALSLGIV